MLLFQLIIFDLVRLNLDGVCADKGCFELLEQYLPNCPIAFLSLRDNNMEQDAQRVLSAARSMKSLQSLDIGGANFVALKANKKAGPTLNKILAELVKLISAGKSVSTVFALALFPLFSLPNLS